MQQIKWFDRKFTFPDNQNIFPSIIDRLKGTSIRLFDKLKYINPDKLTVKAEGNWSIAENIGHLLDLEPIWQGRLADIIEGKTELRAADLKNTKTDLANHNEQNITALVNEFVKQRNITIAQLETLTEEDVFKFALHPRLKTPMRTIDLFLFVAEHDDHHLARITEIDRLLK